MAKQFTDDAFEEDVLKSDKPVLVDFWAPWCGPCQAMGPIIEDTAKEAESFAVIGKMNVDENPKTAEKFGIMSIPTLIIFHKGEAKKQMIGLQSKDTLLEELKKIN